MFTSWHNKHKCLRAFLSIFMSIAFLLEFVMQDARAVTIMPPAGPQASPDEGLSQLNVETFTIPSNLGNVNYTFKGTSDQLVIHIQDAHCNYAAQHQVGKLIDYINKEYGVEIVNLEGGLGNYDLTPFTQIPDKDIRKDVSDYFVKWGEVNGAEYFALNNPDRVKLWGIEDKDLYMKNLSVYRDSLGYKPEAERLISQIDYILNNLRMHMFPRDLKEMDSKYAQYKSGAIEFKEYLMFLINTAKGKEINVKDYPNLYMLKEALDQEGKIDFKRANRERETVVENMQKMLSPKEMREFLNKTLQFKTKAIKETDFYEYLMEKAKTTNQKLDEFAELKKYIVYISLYNAADKMSVMKEMASLEAAIKETMFTGDEQRVLDKLSKNLVLTKNMFDIAFTKDDYRYYTENKASFDVGNYVSFIKANAPRYKIDAKLDENIGMLDDYRGRIWEFFEYSFKRDDAFLSNIRLSGSGTKVAMMVTGGFHTENMLELFRKNNISYVSIIPGFKIEKGYENPYFTVLSGGISPVEKSLEAAMSGIQVLSAMSGLATQDRAEIMRMAASAIAQVEMEFKATGTETPVAIPFENGMYLVASMKNGVVSLDFTNRPAANAAVFRDGQTVYMLNAAGIRAALSEMAQDRVIASAKDRLLLDADHPIVKQAMDMLNDIGAPQYMKDALADLLSRTKAGQKGGLQLVNGLMNAHAGRQGLYLAASAMGLNITDLNNLTADQQRELALQLVHELVGGNIVSNADGSVDSDGVASAVESALRTGTGMDGARAMLADAKRYNVTGRDDVNVWSDLTPEQADELQGKRDYAQSGHAPVAGAAGRTLTADDIARIREITGRSYLAAQMQAMPQRAADFMERNFPGVADIGAATERVRGERLTGSQRAWAVVGAAAFGIIASAMLIFMAGMTTPATIVAASAGIPIVVFRGISIMDIVAQSMGVLANIVLTPVMRVLAVPLSLVKSVVDIGVTNLKLWNFSRKFGFSWGNGAQGVNSFKQLLYGRVPPAARQAMTDRAVNWLGAELRRVGNRNADAQIVAILESLPVWQTNDQSLKRIVDELNKVRGGAPALAPAVAAGRMAPAAPVRPSTRDNAILMGAVTLEPMSADAEILANAEAAEETMDEAARRLVTDNTVFIESDGTLRAQAPDSRQIELMVMTRDMLDAMLMDPSMGAEGLTLKERTQLRQIISGIMRGVWMVSPSSTQIRDVRLMARVYPMLAAVKPRLDRLNAERQALLDRGARPTDKNLMEVERSLNSFVNSINLRIREALAGKVEITDKFLTFGEFGTWGETPVAVIGRLSTRLGISMEDAVRLYMRGMVITRADARSETELAKVFNENVGRMLTLSDVLRISRSEAADLFLDAYRATGRDLAATARFLTEYSREATRALNYNEPFDHTREGFIEAARLSGAGYAFVGRAMSSLSMVAFIGIPLVMSGALSVLGVLAGSYVLMGIGGASVLVSTISAFRMWNQAVSEWRSAKARFGTGLTGQALATAGQTRAAIREFTGMSLEAAAQGEAHESIEANLPAWLPSADSIAVKAGGLFKTLVYGGVFGAIGYGIAWVASTDVGMVMLVGKLGFTAWSLMASGWIFVPTAIIAVVAAAGPANVRAAILASARETLARTGEMLASGRVRGEMRESIKASSAVMDAMSQKYGFSATLTNDMKKLLWGDLFTEIAKIQASKEFAAKNQALQNRYNAAKDQYNRTRTPLNGNTPGMKQLERARDAAKAELDRSMALALAEMAARYGESMVETIEAQNSANLDNLVAAYKDVIGKLRTMDKKLYDGNSIFIQAMQAKLAAALNTAQTLLDEQTTRLNQEMKAANDFLKEARTYYEQIKAEMQIATAETTDAVAARAALDRAIAIREGNLSKMFGDRLAQFSGLQSVVDRMGMLESAATKALAEMERAVAIKEGEARTVAAEEAAAREAAAQAALRPEISPVEEFPEAVEVTAPQDLPMLDSEVGAYGVADEDINVNFNKFLAMMADFSKRQRAGENMEVYADFLRGDTELQMAIRDFIDSNLLDVMTELRDLAAANNVDLRGMREPIRTAMMNLWGGDIAGRGVTDMSVMADLMDEMTRSLDGNVPYNAANPVSVQPAAVIGRMSMGMGLSIPEAAQLYLRVLIMAMNDANEAAKFINDYITNVAPGVNGLVSPGADAMPDHIKAIEMAASDLTPMDILANLRADRGVLGGNIGNWKGANGRTITIVDRTEEVGNKVVLTSGTDRLEINMESMTAKDSEDLASVLGKLENLLDARTETALTDAEKAVIKAIIDRLQPGKIKLIAENANVKAHWGTNGNIYVNRALLSTPITLVHEMLHGLSGADLKSLGAEGINLHTLARGVGAEMLAAYYGLDAKFKAIPKNEAELNALINAIDEKAKELGFRKMTNEEKAFMKYKFGTLASRNENITRSMGALALMTGMTFDLDPVGDMALTEQVRGMKDEIRRDNINFVFDEDSNILKASARQAAARKTARKLESEWGVQNRYKTLDTSLDAEKAIRQSLDNLRDPKNAGKYPMALFKCVNPATIAIINRLLNETPENGGYSDIKGFVNIVDMSEAAKADPANYSDNVVRLMAYAVMTLHGARMESHFNMPVESPERVSYGKDLLTFLITTRYLDAESLGQGMTLDAIRGMNAGDLAAILQKLYTGGITVNITPVNFEEIQDYSESMEAVSQSL